MNEKSLVTGFGIMQPREAEMFYKLLTLKYFQPGTVEDIMEQLDGPKRSAVTRHFIERMIAEGCLNYVGVRPGSGTQAGKEFPIYERNKKRMREFWEKTIYYQVSERFYTLISLPGFEIG